MDLKNIDKKVLLLGLGIVLMIGGIVLSVIKNSTKQETKPAPAEPPPINFSKPETLPPPPNMSKPETLPVPETESKPKPEQANELVKPEPIKPEETKHEKPKEIEKPVKKETKQDNIEIVRVNEREAVIKINGKVYVYERKRETKSRSGQALAKRKQESVKKSSEEKTFEQKERIESGLAIVCSGKSRECLLYEGVRSYRAGDSFRGAKIEKIDIDRVYLSNGQVIRIE